MHAEQYDDRDKQTTTTVTTAPETLPTLQELLTQRAEERARQEQEQREREERQVREAREYAKRQIIEEVSGHVSRPLGKALHLRYEYVEQPEQEDDDAPTDGAHRIVFDLDGQQWSIYYHYGYYRGTVLAAQPAGFLTQLSDNNYGTWDAAILDAIAGLPEWVQHDRAMREEADRRAAEQERQKREQAQQQPAPRRINLCTTLSVANGGMIAKEAPVLVHMLPMSHDYEPVTYPPPSAIGMSTGC